MKYDNCPLYKLQSKKQLKRILSINNKLLKQNYISSMITPYIDTDGKPRLIEPPSKELKRIQRKLKSLLGKIEVPNNVFSGVKGRSYVGNALMHVGEKQRCLFKIDLTAFFPSIKREVVFEFFKNDLECSSDIAEILTNYTTVDINRANVRDIERIMTFLNNKGVNCTNHLISGAPTSQLLSYLVNHRMFDEMQELSNKNNITMTIYVDDVTFSSENKISSGFRNSILKIVKKYGYRISKSKVKNYTKSYPKLITGVVIDKNGNAVVKNSIQERIVKEFRYFKDNPDDEHSRKRLQGLLTAARQVDEHVFPSIYRYLSEKRQ